MSKRLAVAAITTLSTCLAAAILFSFFGGALPLADSVAHFRAHLAIVLLVSVLLSVFLRCWLTAGVAACCSVLGLFSLAPAFPNLTSAAAAIGRPDFTLVQFNLNYRNQRPREVLQLIRDQGADIVTLQEVSFWTRPIVRALRSEFPHQIICRFAGVGSVAVLSRFPKVSSSAEGCLQYEGVAWLRVNINGRAVSVATVHLFWPYPFRQHDQIRRLREPLNKIPRPLLIGGDFNAAPWSHAVQELARATDTRVAGGFRFTWKRPLGQWGLSLGLPIDHILLPAALAGKVDLGPSAGSDHLPVIARLAFRRPGKRDPGAGPLKSRAEAQPPARHLLSTPQEQTRGIATAAD